MERAYHTHGREVCPAKEQKPMTETNKMRDLLAMLRDALQKLEVTIERTRDSVDEIDAQAARLREGIEALSTLQQGEAAAVGIDMVIDAATELLQAFSNLELALPDAQADVETLEAEMEDDQGGRNA
jgi:predicted RNase H-like nuclease (RuvC/YqgF family)